MSRQYSPGMSVIVKMVTRLTAWVILLYGIYIVLNGHLTPGGGFAGGVIIALAFVHSVLAFGREEASGIATKAGASMVEALGAILFLAIALLGLSWGGFFVNFLPKGTPFDLVSAGTIPLSNIAISLKVGAGLFSIFLTVTILMKSEEKK
jgi:multicomponent Na+:H+ antiporter subunit B